MSSEEPKPISVRIIETQYIETDATSFKSVVQKLTGKDAAAPTAAGAASEGASGSGRRTEASEETALTDDRRGSSTGGGGELKEEEIMHMVVPTLDELRKLLGG